MYPVLIPLTPDLLEKCGFRNFVREEWILRMGNSHIDFEFNDEGLRLRQPTYSRISIRYLHQLQNFLFALGGYELEVNLMQGADKNNVNQRPLNSSLSRA